MYHWTHPIKTNNRVLKLLPADAAGLCVPICRIRLRSEWASGEVMAPFSGVASRCSRRARFRTLQGRTNGHLHFLAACEVRIDARIPAAVTDAFPLTGLARLVGSRLTRPPIPRQPNTRCTTHSSVSDPGPRCVCTLYCLLCRERTLAALQFLPPRHEFHYLGPSSRHGLLTTHGRRRYDHEHCTGE